jgi:hypothetical protein
MVLGRDCRNDTEGPPAATGAGTAAPGSALTAVAVAISRLLPGSTAKLVLRLVNNDGDTGSTVRIPRDHAAQPPAVLPFLRWLHPVQWQQAGDRRDRSRADRRLRPAFLRTAESTLAPGP